MKYIQVWIAFFCLLFTVSCVNEIDNYDPPSGGINGRILDEGTGQPIPLPVQGSTGTIINLIEQGTNATLSVDFYAKYDGTYEHSQVFNCDYKVVVNGPFVSDCEGYVTVKGQTTLDLSATPYARIDATASVSGKQVSIQYNVNPANSSFTVSEVYGYWNFVPGVDDGSANYAGKVTVNETSGTITFDLSESEVYEDNLHKIKANGNKIYVRIGALTEGNVNYSTIQTVVVN